MKRITALILCVFMLLPTLTGCEINFKPKEDIPANGEQTENEKPGDDSNGATLPDSPNGNDPASNVNVSDSVDEDGTDWATYDWDNFDEADLLVDIGKASFTVDKSATATGEYIPGEPLSLSITDSADAMWTLDIPAGALLTAQTITMTALRDITTDGLFDTLDGGVLLEPDGLTFFVPATLTVSGGVNGADIIMLSGDHSGGNLDVPYYEVGAHSATIYISHFSSYYALDGSGGIFWDNGDGTWTYQDNPGHDTSQHSKWAEGYEPVEGDDPSWDNVSQEIRDMIDSLDRTKLTKSQKAAIELLKKPVKPPDIDPPSVWFDDCPEKTDISKFLKAFNSPEMPIIEKLWKDQKKASENFIKKYPTPESVDVGKVMDDLNSYAGNMMLAKALYERLAEKANMLIDKYKYMPDKFYAVGMAASMLNVFLGFGKVNIAEMDKWFRETWNYHMHRLVDNHDYHRMHVFDYITLVGAFAGAKVPQDYPQKISNALTFRVEWEMEEHAFFTICSKGEVTVSMNQIKDDDYFGEADGDGKLTKFDDPEGHVYVPSFPSFNNKAQLYKLDPCMTKTISVDIDKFGTDFTAMARTEQGDFPVPFPDYPEPLLHMMDGHFSFSTALYTFKLDLNNLDEKCADSSFKAQQEELSHTLDIKIFHQPKDDVFMK